MPICASAKTAPPFRRIVAAMELIRDSFFLSADTIIANLLARRGEVIPVFLRHRMSCVGCPMSRFETLQSATSIYGLDLDSFLAELEKAIDEKDSSTN